LQDGNTLAHLQFSSAIDVSEQHRLNHFELFPKSLARLVQQFRVEQLQLSFTQGTWKDNRWGVPFSDAPSGVQLISSFLPNSNIKDDWRGLTQALSGMFCSSLGALDATLTADPHHSFLEMINNNEHQALDDDLYERFNRSLEVQRMFNPESPLPPTDQLRIFHGRQRYFHLQKHNTTRVRYGEMPAEAVCTENLTPWIKLLPCRDQSGLGNLFHPLTLYDTRYHSMKTFFRYRTKVDEQTGDETEVMELIQSLTLVFNTTHSSEISLASLFKEDGFSACALSKSSQVTVLLPESDGFELSPSPSESLDNVATYKLKNNEKIDITITRTKPLQQIQFEQWASPITFSRSSLGYGEVNGGILSEITNHENVPITISYFDHLPWFLPIYFHSIRYLVNGEATTLPELSEKWRFQPAEDHGRPSIIEFIATIPPRSRLTIHYHYEKSFMQWTEHPPDAHRGADAPSACVTLVDHKSSVISFDWSQEEANPRIFSNNLLILLPTPDFSMPYNVITLTCTMFAIVFTTTINVLTRKFSYIRKGGEYASGRLSLFLYRKVRDFFLSK